MPSMNSGGFPRRDSVEAAFARISDSDGEGPLAFTRIYEESAKLVAETADRLAGLGVALPSLAGLPISIKDLFDVRGEPTTAGSRILSQAPAPSRDAVIVQRLRNAGAAIVGKTSMTEFAFSGLGINPHFGTPACAWDRPARRIPGGSSSGAAISVTDDMAVAAIGTDTGGSCRIPAAFNGIVGFKPTACAVPLDGALPLSPSFDSIGPLAPDVATCARVFSVLSATGLDLAVRPAETILLGVVRNYVLERMDPIVGASYERGLQRLAASGVRLVDVSLPVLENLPDLFENGGLVAAEAFQWHEELLRRDEASYDPRVAVRIRRGSLLSAADYIRIAKKRRQLIAEWEVQVGAFDALVMPTVPIVAPRIDDLADDGSYGDANLLVLRNPTVVNALDGCAISLPCHKPGDAPVGLMLAAAHGADKRLLETALTVEQLLSTSPREH